MQGHPPIVAAGSWHMRMSMMHHSTSQRDSSTDPRYGSDAHAAWAEVGLAAQLRGVKPLPGGWLQV